MAKDVTEPRRVRVYAAGAPWEAELVAAGLRNHGVDAVLRSPAGPRFGAALPTLDAAPEIWVPAHQAETARRIIESPPADDDEDGRLSLTDAGGDLAVAGAGERPCPECGQTNPGHFSTCWSCQSGLR